MRDALFVSRKSLLESSASSDLSVNVTALHRGQHLFGTRGLLEEIWYTCFNFSILMIMLRSSTCAFDINAEIHALIRECPLFVQTEVLKIRRAYPRLVVRVRPVLIKKWIFIICVFNAHHRSRLNYYGNYTTIIDLLSSVLTFNLAHLTLMLTDLFFLNSIFLMSDVFAFS